MATLNINDNLDCLEFEDFIWSTRKEVLEKMTLRDIIHLQKSLEDPEELWFFLKFYHIEITPKITYEDLVYLERNLPSIYSERQFISILRKNVSTLIIKRIKGKRGYFERKAAEHKKIIGKILEILRGDLLVIFDGYIDSWELIIPNYIDFYEKFTSFNLNSLSLVCKSQTEIQYVDTTGFKLKIIHYNSVQTYLCTNNVNKAINYLKTFYENRQEKLSFARDIHGEGGVMVELVKITKKLKDISENNFRGPFLPAWIDPTLNESYFYVKKLDKKLSYAMI